MNLELYINNRLCDIESPEKLGITLKRVFINPSELSIKDAQKSYDISLPATPVNNEIFNYANVEETQGKFKIYGDARLYVNGVLILDGKFRLSEITKDYYRGNLGVPAPITVKDIFGETMMNQAGKWMIDYKGIESISEINKKENPDCIFPFVLYGLLNKYDPSGKYYSEIKDKDGKNISYKQIYDDSVIHNIKDFPPSVNCIKMLENIFKKAGYNLSGSAIEDERLKNLYVSYKNPESHEAVWGVDKTEIINGTWTNVGTPSWGTIGKIETDIHHINMTDDSDDGYIITDFLNSKFAKFATNDPGMNISTIRKNDIANSIFKVPHSGLYKVFFKAKYQSGGISTNMTSPEIRPGQLDNQFYEIKMLRYTDRSIVEKQQIDNIYYRNNINQLYGGVNNIYPKANNVNFIDPKVNKNLVCGISLGGEQLGDRYKQFVNPLAAGNKYHNPIAITGGTSWTTRTGREENIEKELYRAFSSVKSEGYIYGYNHSPANEFMVPLKNIPPEKETKTIRLSDDTAEGQVSQIIWLEKGEMLTIVSVTQFNKRVNIWQHHNVSFELSLTPFKKNKSWININNYGAGNIDYPMNWNDDPDYKEGEMDLSGFLPSGVKVNDWIDNFCKAFNLELINKNSKNFELNIKKNSIPSSPTNVIDIDNRANSYQCRNESLKLPRLYELGFTIDTAEEGYFRSMTLDEHDEQITNSGTDGKGLFYTGSNETATITQSSNFSYCWYKDLYNKEGKLMATIPVISDHEIWDHDYDYKETAGKSYYDKAQRFWYRNGVLPVTTGGKPMDVALVSNEHEGIIPLALDYEYKPNSIMKNFFLILTNNNNDYTTVNCFLSAEEYARLDKSLIRFNSDLYNVAEVDGYDPLRKQQCTLKLIRRII